MKALTISTISRSEIDLPAMNPATRLLEGLVRVSQHGTGRWRAVCPAHKSRHQSQSLAIRELPDGTLLVRCHFGCSAADIVDAIGLELRDLFPAGHRAPHEPRGTQRPNHWHAGGAALQTVYREAFLILLVAEDVAAGRVPSAADIERCALAAARIRHAYEGIA